MLEMRCFMESSGYDSGQDTLPTVGRITGSATGGLRMMEALLAELEPLLYGYNYQVFLRVYRVPFAPR